MDNSLLPGKLATASKQADAATLAVILPEVAVRIGVQVPRLRWQRQVERMGGESSVQAWFAAAATHLGIECVAVDASHSLPAGVYIWAEDEGWKVAARSAKGGWSIAEAPVAAEVRPQGQVYRVVQAKSFGRIGWPQIKQAALSDRSILREVLIGTLLINAFALVIPLYLNAIYDRVLPAQAATSLWVLSLGVVLCIGLELVLRNERSRALMRLSEQLQYGLLPQVAKQIGRAPLVAEQGWGAAGIKGFAALARLRSLYWGIAGSTVADLAFAALYLAIIAWLGGLIALIPVLILATGAWSVWRFDKGLQAMGPEESTPFSLTPAGFALHRSINAEPELVREYLIASEAARLREQQRFALQARCNSQLSILSNAQTVLIVVAAYHLVSMQWMQPAGIFATILLAGRMFQPLSSLMTALPSMRQIGDCVREVNQVLEQVPDEPVAVDVGLVADGWRLEDVSFGYNKHVKVLGNISLRIQPGERVALVGPPGAGKTTLIQLLMGVLQPAAGSLTWGGAELSEVRAQALRERTHYAWQGSEMPGTTPQDFFSIEREVANEELVPILRKLKLAATIARWPQGLATPFAKLPPLNRRVHELMAIARAALSDRDIYCLDAPSESLDQDAESNLIEVLEEKRARGATLIVATDRSSLLRLVDRVIYINDGAIRFDGSVEKFMMGEKQTASI